MTTSRRSSLTAIVVSLTSIVLMTAPTCVQARIKCWENSDGIKECGTSIPPEYSQKGYKEINKQGITVHEEAKAKTKEERLEEERLVAIREKEEAEKAKEAIQDKFLLDTYSSVDEIQKYSDEKIAALDSAIQLMRTHNKRILGDLDKLTTEASSTKADDKKAQENQENLLKDIESLQRQIKNNDKFIADKKIEQQNIATKHAEKIKRFEELAQ